MAKKRAEISNQSLSIEKVQYIEDIIEVPVELVEQIKKLKKQNVKRCSEGSCTCKKTSRS